MQPNEHPGGKLEKIIKKGKKLQKKLTETKKLTKTTKVIMERFIGATIKCQLLIVKKLKEVVNNKKAPGSDVSPTFNGIGDAEMQKMDFL